MMPDRLTFRDRVKVACLQSCIEAGLDETQMIGVFEAATARLRSGGTKEAALVGPPLSILKSLGSLGVLGLGLGIPVAGLSAAALGNIGGNAARNIAVGRLPSPAEIKTLDEIAAMNRTRDEIRGRLTDAEAEKKRKAKPSVRKMF